MKKLVNGVVVLAALLLMPAVLTAQVDSCSMTINGHDSYSYGGGDGWNGNSLTVWQNGVQILSFTVPNLSQDDSVTFNVGSDAPVCFVYTLGGSTTYPGENSFVIRNNYGEVVYTCSSGANLTSGDTCYKANVPCPSCASPTALVMSDYTNNGVTLSWTPVGEETSWIVLVDGEAAAGSPVSESSIELSGYEANTEYTVEIMAVCDDGNTSRGLSGAFKTLCQNGNCEITVTPSSTSTSSYYKPYVKVMQDGLVLSTGNGTRDVEICNGDSVFVILTSAPSTNNTPSLSVTDVAGTVLFSGSVAGRSAGDTVLAVANGCPSCMPVNAVYRESEDAYTTNLHWIDNNVEGLGDYVIYVNGVVAGTVSVDSTYVLNTTPMTEYIVNVVRVCTEDDTSAARTVRFTSPCDESTYAPLPFSSGFEDLDPTADHQTNLLPDCWLQVATGTNTTLVPNPVFPMAYRHTPNAHNSDVYFEFESNQGETEILALPRMENVSNLQLSFYASVTNISNFRLEAGVVEIDEEGNYVFVPVDTVDLIQGTNFSTGYNVYNIPFNTYEGDGERLALRTTSTGSGTYTLMIDDFSVIYAGSPVLGPFIPATHTVNADTNLVLTANLMSGEGVTYTWNSKMVTDGHASIVGQDSNTVTINYTDGGIDTVSVTASTGFGEDATASVVVYVIDLSPVTEFPYTTSFEDGEDISFRTANNANGWYVGTATASTGTHSLYVSSTHGETNVFSNQASANSFATRQLQFSEAGEYNFSFSWKNNGSSGAYMRSYLVQGNYQPSAGSSPSGTNLTGNLYGTTEWEQADAVLDVDTGLYTIVFYWYNGYLSSSNNPPAAVDDISIQKLNCSRVGNLEAHNVYAHEADIVWTPRNEESEWWVVVDSADGYAVQTDSIHVDGFEGQTQHTVSIRAICGEGDTSAARTVSFTTTIACPAVSGIHATEITSTGATITWTPGGNETAWRIVVGDGDTIDVTDSSSYDVTGLEANTEYTVTVIANCGEDDGLSVNATGTFRTACAGGNCEFTVDMADSWGDGWNGGAAIYVYQNGSRIETVTLSGYSSSGTMNVSTCLGDSVILLWHRGGTYDYECSFIVKNAADSVLLSSESIHLNDGDSIMIFDGQCNAMVIMTPDTSQSGTDCDAPTNLTATPGDTAVYIAFSGDADGYEVGIIEGDEWNEDDADIEDTEDTEYTFSDLTAGTTYTIGVRAVCEGIYSWDDTYSTWVTTTVTTTGGEPDTCNAPTALQTVSVDSNRAVISWTAGGDETAWQVMVNNDQENLLSASNNPTYVMSNLTPGTEYRVRVRAVCSATNQSGWSSELSFITSNVGIEVADGIVSNLSPNPATSMVTIETVADAQVSIIDLNGRVSGVWRTEDGKLTVDVSGMVKGAYFVRIVTEKGCAVRKLIVR